MKMFRKLVSIVAAATLLTSSMAFSFSANAAKVDDTAAVASEPNLQDDPADGVILHAFNWSYNSIKQNLPQIAAAGYTTVQTSPVTQPKDYGPWSDVSGQWSKLYQPVSLSIAQSSWLGTKQDLTDLCAEADKYGIKIIVDIVSNHMANLKEASGTVNMNKLSEEVKTYEPTLYNSYSTYFHSETYEASDSSAESMTRGHVSQCPDLNTANATVQDKVYNLLKECIDCGVDGFRFDAAKHIETEADGSVYSQFWANTLDKAKTYYKNKTGKDLFAYGEILNSLGGRNVNAYTKRMRITENKYSDNILVGVNSNNTSKASATTYQMGGSASSAVVWAESHDTYMGESGSMGLSNTAGVSDAKIVNAWAIVAARQGSTPLYFARPGSALMGEAANDLTYKSTVVSEVNKFHNAFAKVSSEKVGVSGSTVYVARGNAGVVLSNITGAAASVNISGTGLADGTYTDTVTGNTFTVSGGALKGDIGSTGVAVVYKSTTTPKAVASVESGNFTTDTIVVSLSYENAVSGTYALENSAPVSFTGTKNIRIGSDYKVGETITLNLTATDAAGNTAKSTYLYTKKQPTTSGIYVFLKPTIARTWTNVSCYVYDEDTKSKTITYSNGGWPGQAMTYDETLGYYYIEIPAACVEQNATTGAISESTFDLPHSANTYVIFNGSKNGNTTQYPAANAIASQKLKLGGGASNKVLDAANASGWKNTTMTPTKVEIDAEDVTKGEPVTEPDTEPTTAPETEPETKVVEIGKYGDVNRDGKINVNDVTAVQRHKAQFEQLDKIGLLLADVDFDGAITIKDATYIQMYAAEYPRGYEHTGETCTEYREVDPDSEKFAVTANSNFFPKSTVSFDTDTATITVTYFINSEKDLLNADWLLSYDKTALEPTIVNMPNMQGLTVNNNPESVTSGGVSGNISNLKTIPLSKDGNQVPFVSATFKVLNAKDTTVDLRVKDLQVSKVTGSDTSRAANEEDIVLNNVVQKPEFKYDLVTSIYSGPLNENYTNANDPVIHYNPKGEDPTDPSTEPITDPVPATTRTILFSNNKGWTNVCIHFWGSSIEADTEWPGVPMNDAGTNGYGEQQFSYDIPTDVEGFVINGTEGQTVDIAYDDYSTGWYPLDTQDDLGHYEVDSWIEENPDPKPDDPTDPIGETKTIEFTDNKGWGSVNIYIYGPDGELSEWPGFGMNKKGDNGYGGVNYYYEVPTNAEFIIFSGPSGDQTVDVYPDFSVTGYYPTEEKDEMGHWQVDSWIDDGSGSGSGGGSTGDGGEILFTDNKGWGNAYIYYFGSDNDPEWPGVPMNAIGTNDYGESQYSYTLPAGVELFVFNNGNGEQTVDAYDTSVTGYYPLDTKDSEGKWELGSWTSDGGTVSGEFYLIGYINGADYGDGEDYANMGDYKFVNGKVTATFSEDSYVCVKSSDMVWYMTNGFQGTDVTSVTLYNSSITGESSDKMYVPAGTVTFTLTANSDGTLTLSTDGTGGGDNPQPPVPSDTKSVQFTDNNGWGTVYAYAFNDDGELMGAWPGTAMTNIGDNGMGKNNFSANVPTNATYIIFNGGLDAAQTVDIPFDSSAAGWYLTGDTDENGKYVAQAWYEGSESTTKTVIFSNNKGWGNVYIHYWGGSSESSWPGVAMTYIGTNDYGEKQYSAEIPADTTGLVFHNNSGTQTNDITNLNVTGYYLTNQTNGKWDVGTW